MERRNRILRTNPTIRAMVAETELSPGDFIAPLFVTDGIHEKTAIASMPGYFRYSLDLISQEVKELWELGIHSVLIFVKVPDYLKDNSGAEATNPDGLMQRAIKTIKNFNPDICLMTDVALDPYSSFGHDGIVENGKILNDKTVETLAKMSLSHAQAGADFVAPSDMMDGRIRAIRDIFEINQFVDTGIMAYSAKYASCFYGPFREALDSNPGFGDKGTYQMDSANSREALKEVTMDFEEGADIVMIKPALPYLDIIKMVKEKILLPVSAYQVSGEYSMIKASAEKGWVDEEKAILETLTSIKRSGADLIATYFAKEASMLLQK